MGETWTIVLAGGAGTRLGSAARRLYGYERPKQFCDFDGRGTLLDQTLHRAFGVAPGHRTVVVTTQPWSDREGAECLARYARVHHLAQPRGRDTGPGVALPLAWVAEQDPGGIVAILPSDHHVGSEEGFVDAVNRAVDVVRRGEAGVILLGAEPHVVEDGLGWIVPEGSGPCSGIRAFREKPTTGEADQLFRSGALVNTFVMVARTSALATLCARHMPAWWWALTTGAGQWGYRELPKVNFSRVVLEHAVRDLHVMSLGDVGWSDIGTPERLRRVLALEPEAPAGAPGSEAAAK